MNEADILRHIHTAYGAMIIEAAAQHRHRSEVLAGIVMRETQGGLSPLLDRPGPAAAGSFQSARRRIGPETPGRRNTCPPGNRNDGGGFRKPTE
jgi:hypothetical protein